jgi:uncharacterized protein YcaQ
MAYSMTRDELCSYLIHYHSLNCFKNFIGESGVKELFKRIGCIQYDPLNVVSRNPYLVLQSRIKGFTVNMLDKLLYEDRFLIDGWDKEMSIYRTQDWPYFRRIRKCREESTKYMLARREQEEVLSYIPQILTEFQHHSYFSANDIDLGPCKAGRWGHKKISGAAMDYLFAKGDIGIYRKKNVQKVYGMIDNLIPYEILNASDPFCTDIEFYEWYFMRRIGSLGVHWLRNGGGWNGHYLSDSQLRKGIFESLENKGLILPITVPEINETFYIRKQDLSMLDMKPDYDEYIRILAPLDNLLWDRTLVYKLFNFQYSWEVYLPEEKRKYGYYVLPVLYQNKIIARMEPIKQEVNKPFRIKNWWWEPNISKNSRLKHSVKNGLKLFAQYLGADGIEESDLKMVFAK